MHRYAIPLLAAVALTAPLATSAQTLDLPSRKAGLWEVVTKVETPEAVPPMTSRMCLDAETDREIMSYALKLTDGKCKDVTTTREGETYVVSADCTFAGKRTRSRTVIEGDFQSAYTTRTEATLGGGGNDGKARQSRMTQTATWKNSECPDMKPGDISMPGGLKVNIEQLKTFSGLLQR